MDLILFLEKSLKTIRLNFQINFSILNIKLLRVWVIQIILMLFVTSFAILVEQLVKKLSLKSVISDDSALLYNSVLETI